MRPVGFGSTVIMARRCDGGESTTACPQTAQARCQRAEYSCRPSKSGVHFRYSGGPDRFSGLAVTPNDRPYALRLVKYVVTAKAGRHVQKKIAIKTERRRRYGADCRGCS